MSNSNHRIICTDCGRDQPVVEDAISNPAIKPPGTDKRDPESAGAPLARISMRPARTTPAPRGAV